MTSTGVGIIFRHLKTALLEKRAHTVQPFVQPDFADDRNIPRPRWRVSYNCKCRVIRKCARPRAKSPPATRDLHSRRKILLWPENEDRVVFAGWSIRIEFVSNVVR